MGLLRKFLNQTRRPEGLLGRIMLNGMNFGHAFVADWAISLMQDMLNAHDVNQIAELGCGNGRDAGELLKIYKAAKLTAVDYSPLSVEKTIKNNQDAVNAGRMKVIHGDVSNLHSALEPQSFDLATAFETIYFWPGLTRCFEQVFNILKPNGHFMIVTESDGRDKISKWFQKRIDGMNTYTSSEIEAALNSAGFAYIKSTHHKSRPWLMILARR
ncbi:MAG: class I SAM-dependent methyltransferase [Synergistaceae bacterium]|nr:class I SAM-dependent methyltransferase [Synergistaceae bacterium]